MDNNLYLCKKSNSMYSSQEIADWILSRINGDAGDTISPLKLQKLLYYCQAWHYTIFDERLFDEDIEAWAHGPVIPSQYRRFASIPRYANIDIDKLDMAAIVLPLKTKELLEEVMDIYGEHSAYFLEQLTHNERPWKETRGDLPPEASSDKIIPLNLMKEYYQSVNK